MYKIVFDLEDIGVFVDRSKYCRWHFCNCDKYFLIRYGIDAVLIYN